MYDLKKYLNLLSPGNRLDSFRIKIILFQTLSGLAEIHQHKILHRDLKPQNILIDINGVVKINQRHNYKS